ncbi:MAG: ribosomal protein small subunit ribosomal protein [Candidatus Kaiserbacteria bacterium]|nr:ribosomal protein small subunit ribosomal protein [Candidatus Kaiserbacteria bacterium]
MQRTGRIKIPTYRIVVAEHTSSPKAGTNVEVVGTYNPKIKVPVLNADRIKYWISVGAKPSDTVHNMLVSQNVIPGTKINVLPKMKNRAAPVVEEAPVEAPVEAPAPTPAPEEVPAVEETPVPEEVTAPEETPAPEEVPAETPTEEAAA